MSTGGLVARRRLLLALTGLTTGLGTLQLWQAVQVDGLTLVELGIVAIFILLFTWIASAFWIACFGAWASWRNEACMPLEERRGPDPGPTRTAIVMPIHNEDPDRVFAGLRATLESLRATGELHRFALFVLSDSTDPDRWAPEEVAWQALREAMPGAWIYYRRRARNVGRKSGNIQDFCEGWGALYDHMVVLDADSLMTGETLVRLVRLMDANPKVALIQAGPILVGGTSLFARLQQFASSIYGPVFMRGVACLHGGDSNYWGHNAIIRVKPFMDHCGLPPLPGRAPLGGEIMSHDFVEAALLRRAGWQVWLAPHLGGSYEAPPPTLIEYLKRDRRWCQGNLQHIRLIAGCGFHMSSRLHFAAGVMSYLSSPLWLVLLLLYALEAFRNARMELVVFEGPYPVLVWPVSNIMTLASLVAAAAALLFGPKLMAMALAMRNRETARAHGGRLRLAVSVMLETVYSTLLAPVLMLTHSWFVLNILLGRTTGWGGQQRDAQGIALGEAARTFAPHVLVALAGGALAWLLIPESFWWFAPLLLGLLLAVVLCRITSLPHWGRITWRWGLFLVPCEVDGLPVVDRFRRLQGLEGLAGEGPRIRLDPVPARR